MALPYAEGEVYFKREALTDPHKGWTANNEESFWQYGLIEFVWNQPAWGGTASSNPGHGHPRSKWQVGRGDGYNTLFAWWDKCSFCYTTDPRGQNVTYQYELPLCTNPNSFRDRWKNDTSPQVVIAPFRLSKENYLFIDLVMPIRAIYLPLAYKSDAAFEDLSTYLMVDFRLRKGVKMRWGDAADSDVTFDSTFGLNFNHGSSLSLNLQSCYFYLALPRQVRNPDKDLYWTEVRGQECIKLTNPAYVKAASNISIYTAKYFGYTMDLAKIISANYGVELVWRPYEHNSWIASFMENMIAFALDFVPVVGPLLSVGFTFAWEAIENPQAFQSDNVLDLLGDTLTAVVDSASQYRNYTPDGFYEVNSSRKLAPSSSETSGVTSETGPYNTKITQALQRKAASVGPSPSLAFTDRLPPNLFDPHQEDEAIDFSNTIKHTDEVEQAPPTS